MKKVTWRKVRKDFEKRFPGLNKQVTYWRPYDFATILLYLKDGQKITYNYDLQDIKKYVEE